MRVWQFLSTGNWEGRGEDPGMHRVATRLAAQTVALLLVMLVALEIVVYVITQHALLSSLEGTLRDGAHPPPDMVQHIYSSAGGNPGRPQPPGERDHRPPPPYVPRQQSGDVSSALLDTHLHPIGGEGFFARVVMDPAAARQVLRTRRDLCCPIANHDGESYLTYTAVVRGNQGQILGVAQANISARQYQSALDTLVRTLLLVALLGLLVSGIVSAVLVRRSLQPIRVAVKRQRDFVADAAHELRTPLAIMRTVGEVGLADGAVEDQRVTIEQMLAENRHLTRLVDDLSLLARTDAHVVSIERTPVDLSHLVSDTTAELGPVAEEQGVRLTADVRGAVQVVGDMLRLRQLLLILLDNALKHTPPSGAVRVSLDARGGRATLQVADTGPGIAPEDLTRIFDRFYRADRARTGEGTGLGLAIGRWIAEAHGGQIVAGNAPEGGALFTVSLPLSRAGDRRALVSQPGGAP